LHAQAPGARVTGSRLVCYAYPKIAIELSYVVDDTAAIELFDASSGSTVGTSDDAHDQFTRYSLLAHVAEQREERLRGFQRTADRMQRIASAVESPPAMAPPAAPPALRLPIITISAGMVRQSPYCPGSSPGNSRYAQITDYFCVDASAQMLMEHYGWNYTQNQIAVAMSTTAAAGGTSQNGLETGFASLTHNQFDLTFDWGGSRAQQFDDAVSEVNANRPLFTQVPHHYRVCMGYGQIALDRTPLDQWLYIYDPWPWNPDLCQAGPPYWESWSSSPVMWFGIVHHA
jgi:Peptidase_C39 like family